MNQFRVNSEAAQNVLKVGVVYGKGMAVGLYDLDPAEFAFAIADMKKMAQRSSLPDPLHITGYRIIATAWDGG